MLQVTFELEIEANINGADVVQHHYRVTATGVPIPREHATREDAIAIAGVSVADVYTGRPVDIEASPDIDRVYDEAELQLRAVAYPYTTTVPVSIVGHGIEGRMKFLRVELPAGPVEFSFHDYHRLPPSLVAAAKAGAGSVELTDAEITAVGAAKEAAARAIAGNTGVARSTRARGR